MLPKKSIPALVLTIALSCGCTGEGMKNTGPLVKIIGTAIGTAVVIQILALSAISYHAYYYTDHDWWYYYWNDELKTTEQAKEPIKAFTSDEDAKKAYDTLWKEEQALSKSPKSSSWDYIKSFFVKDPELSKHHKKLKDFYQRLFRTITKKDIEKKKDYTQMLGLQAKNDGSLTMERLPITLTEAIEQNKILFKS